MSESQSFTDSFYEWLEQHGGVFDGKSNKWHLDLNALKLAILEFNEAAIKEARLDELNRIKDHPPTTIIRTIYRRIAQLTKGRTE